MRYLCIAILIVGTLSYATTATAQVGRSCTQVGQIVIIGGKRYRCVRNRPLDQARRPNWDGRSKKRAPNRGHPEIKSTRTPTNKAVFPGLSKDQFKRLSNTTEGRALIRRADELRRQKAKDQKAFRKAVKSGSATTIRHAQVKLRNTRNTLSGMQARAKKILVEVK